LTKVLYQFSYTYKYFRMGVFCYYECMDINNPFETFERYAFRLEALPEYIVSEEIESLKHFQETGLTHNSGSEWAELVSNNINTGKKMERLRLLSEHLTDYERYELQAYSGPEAGEHIHVALKKEYLEEYLYDFWFFDDKWIAQVNYEEDGTFINFDVRSATQAEIHAYTYWHSIYENAEQLRQVPFVANTVDDTHCLQAAYMSAAKYFDPGFDIPMEEWSAITGYEEGLGTWANAGLVWFKENGYDVKHYELFDFEEFIRRPKEYMIEVNGEEAGKWGFEHTNVPVEIERMKKLVASGIAEKRRPSIEDIKHFIDDGYLVRVTINCGTLDGTHEYIGHAVIITSYNNTYIQFHDPGLPPIPNRQATYEDFEAAWSDQEKELDAIKLIG